MTIRLIIHAPTPAALSRARSNARNLLASHPDALCEIIANATAAKAALDLPDPVTDGILFLCANSLQNQGAVAPHTTRVVAAAVAHIARRQLEGWQYMRA